MLDKTMVRKIAEKYSEEVRKVLNPDAILLFGSYVNGNPNEWSDIDIAVVMNDFQGDWLETYAMLFGLKRNVNLDIEPHLLDETCDRSGFLAEVYKTGQIIYKA
ncbi:MAG: nucleotidyltransferase domain-containing protein [Oscillospiraceae bacterium]|nr:nucleotidyltransferase domain-containing protein [Oscillospiraceae bacterium]